MCFTVAAQRRIFTCFTIRAKWLEYITNGPSLAGASGAVLVGLLTCERENPAFSSSPALGPEDDNGILEWGFS